MKIFIPKHLEKIKVVSQLAEMVRAYQSQYQETSGSFDYYYYFYSFDAVQKFLRLCITSSDIAGSNDLESVINYLVHLFYSVKGTRSVFDYMRDYLGVPFVSDPVYTVDTIRLEISEITTIDMSLYIEYMKEFLDALLYYSDLRSNIEQVKLMISGEISNSLGLGLVGYKEFEATEITDENNI